METQAATLPRVFSFGFWKILCKGTGQVMFHDYRISPEVSRRERNCRTLGIQRGFGRMCLTDIFRECTLNVVGHCYLFLYDNLGHGRIEPFIGSL